MNLAELEPIRLFGAGGLLAAYLTMCLGILLSRQRQGQAARQASAALAGSATPGEKAWLDAHASQNGQAEELAWQTARALHAAGVPARLLPLGELQAADLLQAEKALFIVSTYGEGDAPDSAISFATQVLGQAVPLSGLQHAVLALGDRSYQQFCGFGRGLDAWLKDCGARPLFDRIEVDQGDEASQQQWRQQLGRLAGTAELAEWQAPPAQPWRLLARRHLNPGSAGGPVFHLELAPADPSALPHWEAGDLVQVQAPADPERPREYSIASVPADGRLHLLVRQERHPDGRLGLASGFLTAQAELDTTLQLRLRPHRNFRLGEDNADRPLILIGNGTGLAGLRSHIKARSTREAPLRHWLIFGERQAAHDFHHRDEIEAWMAQGVLERCDMVFSRELPAARRYVQDRLRECADSVRDWLLKQGAAIYVCGSLEGMAGGVHAALSDILGAETLAQLMQQGRYRRDVY